MSASGFQKAVTGFREHLPDLNTPRFQIAKDQDAYEYTETFHKTQVPPWLYNLTQAWEELLNEAFVGITTDGKIVFSTIFSWKLTSYRYHDTRLIPRPRPRRLDRRDSQRRRECPKSTEQFSERKSSISAECQAMACMVKSRIPLASLGSPP